MISKRFFTGILILVFLFSTDLIAQKKKEKYKMYSTVEMKPVRGKEKALESAVKEHNAKFHTEDPYKAILRTILTGPKSGYYVWIMGPSMYSDMDNRPNDKTHEDDWNNTVDPNVKHYGTVEYWKFNAKQSFTAPDSENNKFSTTWFIDVKNDQYEKFNTVLTKAMEVNKKRGSDSFHVYNNEFNAGDGRDIALVFSFKTWSDLDIDDPFKIRFEAMYGEGSWKTFLEDWNSSIDGINQMLSKNVE